MDRVWLLPDRVFHVLGRLTQRCFGLVCLSLGLEFRVIRRLAYALLDVTDGVFRCVMYFVVCSHVFQLTLVMSDCQVLEPTQRSGVTYVTRVALDVVTDPLPPLRIAIAPGVSVGKWTSRWAERRPDVPVEVLPVADSEGVSVLHSGAATASFLRLPIDRDGLSVIRLYEELSVLVVSRDSELAQRESISTAELADLVGVVAYPPAGAIKDAVALVAAGVGFLRLPFSVARFAARKDVVAVPIADAEPIEVAMCWLADSTTDEIDQFVGIVRGRTANSSR